MVLYLYQWEVLLVPDLYIRFPMEFCSKQVSRNRDETNFVITRNKVVILRNSVLRGMAHFVSRNQCCRSGSARIRIILLDPDPH